MRARVSDRSASGRPRRLVSPYYVRARVLDRSALGRSRRLAHDHHDKVSESHDTQVARSTTDNATRFPLKDSDARPVYVYHGVVRVARSTTEDATRFPLEDSDGRLEQRVARSTTQDATRFPLDNSDGRPALYHDRHDHHDSFCGACRCGSCTGSGHVPGVVWNCGRRRSGGRGAAQGERRHIAFGKWAASPVAPSRLKFQLSAMDIEAPLASMRAELK